MLWLVLLVPTIAAPAVWVIGRTSTRSTLAATASSVLAATLGLAVWAAVTRPTGAYRWGAGLTLRLSVDAPAAVTAVLVPAVALVVVAYAAFHESAGGLGRLVATLVGFVGAMELLVLADDVVTLLVGWELVGACSWALIAHDWGQPDAAPSAAHAFVATHLGDLGLFAAAGAAMAGTGSVRFGALAGLSGGWLHLFVAGVLLAAVAKSAQLPFSPWLFSAMAGPTSVSALLHAATMVAAGTFVLIRLHPVLAAAGWFSPAVIAIGLVTAFAGGVVALLQQHAKKVLAASTSAHYGLMFVAVGAGVPAAALAHLVVHAAFKAGLFLSAGIAIEAAGSPQLGRMRLGRDLPVVAAFAGVAALALAGVPPLGGAWTKEAIGAAAGEHGVGLAVAVAVAGALSAAYATRFQLLAFGPSATGTPRPLARHPTRVEIAALGAAATASLGFGLLWVPGGRQLAGRLAGSAIPTVDPWELALALALIAVATYAAVAAWRRDRLLGHVPDTRRARAAEWFALSTLSKVAVVDPTIRLSSGLAWFDDRIVDAPSRWAAVAAPAMAHRLGAVDDRVVDGGVRLTVAFARAAASVGASVTEAGAAGAATGLAALVGRGGRDARRLQTGRAHQYYVFIAAGIVALIVIAAAGR